jgi:uncharacterized membrane protein YjjP (DUF1212 family)
MTSDSATTDVSSVLEFMFRLGQAYLASGEQTAKIELSLRRVATACGIRRSRVVVFPTAVLITLHEGSDERVTIAEGPTQKFRLDQIADVYALGAAAERGEVASKDGLQKLNEIQRTAARFGPLGVIAGHAILSIGLSMVLMPSPMNMAASAVLGAVVGALKLFNRDRPVLDVPLPVVAAALVSSLVYMAARYGTAIVPTYILIPPLVSFLPGAMLTLGMVELAYGDMISGSSRLITGFVQLVLLAFGLAVGAGIVGVPPESLVDAGGPVRHASWLQWLGVIVFGIGVFLHFSAPRNSLVWMMVVLLAAFAAQRVGAAITGDDEVSGFFGMLVATPLGYLVQLRFNGPPAMVTYLPSFWLLVPGALGLISVTRMLSDRAAGIDGLTTAMFAFASIAVGTLMGASLYKWLTETFGWWQLQLGRVGSRFRRGRRQ